VTYRNPFPSEDADRRAIWEMLVERDIEAFVNRDWSMVAADFIGGVGVSLVGESVAAESGHEAGRVTACADAFWGLDARGSDDPDSWRLTFPTLASYRTAWLEQSEQMARRAAPDAIRNGLIGATTLQEIEITGDAALAHKKFDGAIALLDGGSERLSWQTLYHFRKVKYEWKIAGFVGYLPNSMGRAEPARGPIREPPGAAQHRTAGPYSPVLQVAADELVVISGQAALAEDGSVVGDDVTTQARATLENCRRQLATAGCGLDDVFKATVYLTDLSDWQAFNEVYASVMPDPKPVRTAVQAALLPGLLVEVEMWAAKAR
jgi:enamine deaminase RidA (YjgF/YER057c/UK114 family)